MSVYLVTGASGDMGRAFLARICRAGDTVLAQGTGDLAPLRALAESLPCPCHIFDADLSAVDGVKGFVEALEATGLVPTHFLHLPALPVVNTKYKNFDFERYLLDMNVQVTSALLLTRWALPKMAGAGFGRVVFLLTSYLIGPPPKNVESYLVAKSGLLGLAKGLAVDYAKNGVTVNCVLPSMVETSFLRNTSDLIVEASARANPMGRNATVDDVVPAIAFFMGEEARFITGAALPVTGGSAF